MHVVFPCFRVCLTCKSRRSSVSCQYSVSCTTRGISLISVIYRFHLSVASASLVSFCEKAVLSHSCSAKKHRQKSLANVFGCFRENERDVFFTSRLHHFESLVTEFLLIFLLTAEHGARSASRRTTSTHSVSVSTAAIFIRSSKFGRSSDRSSSKWGQCFVFVIGHTCTSTLWTYAFVWFQLLRDALQQVRWE